MVLTPGPHTWQSTWSILDTGIVGRMNAVSTGYF